RRLAGLDRLEAPVQVAQEIVVKTGADAPGVAQAASRLLHAQEERAEAHARALRIAEAADHEFLARRALHLEPVGAASRARERRAPLAHDAFEPALARLREEGFSLPDHVLADAQHGGIAAADESHERAFSLLQGHAREAPSVLMEKIEDEVDEL